ncbi:MAG: ribosomal RNA small subunit methyltransferase A, partial [Clostridia bacterium]|nr:ribosomal RNA small subunit methyltransferase A [Clostridia bacterium]
MQIKETIKKNGFCFKKNLGQNFIEDDVILSKIADSADICGYDDVLEIGTGAGTLTKAVAARARKVVSYEIDKNLRPVLSETLKGVDNAEVVFKDFMRADMSEVEKDFDKEYIVVANLPYYITSPIVMKLLEEGKKVKRIVVTVQKEVADRFCAAEGSSEYGAITVAINALGYAKTAMLIPRENFYPAPNVDSAVVRIDVDRNKFTDMDYNALRDTVRAAFSSRRKT